MKKIIPSIVLFLCAANSVYADAIKLKSGVVINGSIIGQSEFILNVKTSYGTISLNQREVDSIMPDLYRVRLKGGGEFVGTVSDMDEFNLSLLTDNGKVNVDVNDIASMEIYDYDEAEKQKKYVENKIKKESEAAAALAAERTPAAQAVIANAGGSAAGLSFDEDLEKVFPSKPAVMAPREVINYRSYNTAGQTESGDAAVAAQEESDDKKRFAGLQDDDVPTEQAKRKDNAKNYFSVQTGVLSSGIKADYDNGGRREEKSLSGSDMAFGIAYLRRMTNRLWFGADLLFGMLPEKSVTMADGSQYDVSGEMYQIDAIANFYVNPRAVTRLYLTGGLGYSSTVVGFNAKSTSQKTKGISSSGLGASCGLGVERSILDLNLGLEARANFAAYGNEFKGSRSANYFTALKISWFF